MFSAGPLFSKKLKCPHQESNLDCLLRRQELYPLSYGDDLYILQQ